MKATSEIELLAEQAEAASLRAENAQLEAETMRDLLEMAVARATRAEEELTEVTAELGLVLEKLLAERERATEWRTAAIDLVFLLFMAHPLPWRLEKGWQWEVIAGDGYTVARCRTEDEARRILTIATQLHADGLLNG